MQNFGQENRRYGQKIRFTHLYTVFFIRKSSNDWGDYFPSSKAASTTRFFGEKITRQLFIKLTIQISLQIQRKTGKINKSSEQNEGIDEAKREVGERDEIKADKKCPPRP